MKLGIRIWILIILLLASVLAIAPWQALQSGVTIESIGRNSTAFEAGLRSGMVIESINNQNVRDVEDYTGIMKNIDYSGDSIRMNFITDQGEFIFLADEDLDITVKNIPPTALMTGLDLSGGSRALVEPKDVDLTHEEMEELISVTEERFNVYGLADVSIRSVEDLEGNLFMMVEIAGATPDDLENLVSEQGVFEAKIGNQTVFEGAEDITSVCRDDATCARIQRPEQTQEGYFSRFEFSIHLSQDAARRHAEITDELEVNVSEDGRYLDKKLDLYLDGEKVSSLAISADLKGRETTQISISGSGTGTTEEDAYEDAEERMNHLQTVLITGSLPYELEIAMLDTISPVLGRQFINYLLVAGIASLIAVALIVFVRYRDFKPSLALLFTSTSETVIILGIAALIGWRLDLASIAGILAVIGTGVDQQIIIIDESKSGDSTGIMEKIKRALAIIIGAYLTSLAALIPIYWAGAGLLRGFAVTTIIGITAGVLITRPAFGDLLKMLEKK